MIAMSVGAEIAAMELFEGSDSSLSSVPSSPSRGSSPLSSLSRSPSPPPELRDALSDILPRTTSRRRNLSHVLPTPPRSQDSSMTGSPAPDAMDSSMLSDGQPPAKRRRVETRERTTERLNLCKTHVKQSEQEHLNRLLQVIHKRRKIVVIAGAGISVSAGIPDFRSSTGLFSSLKTEHKMKGSGKDLFDASVYRDDTSTTSFHSMVSSMSRMTKDAKPTAFHHMLATLAHEGRLLRLYSQNVDGIDTSLEPLSTAVPLRKDESGKWPKTVQLHGGLDKMVCSKCQHLSDLDADLFDGPIAPLCTSCEEHDMRRTVGEGKRSHGIGRLRPRMVLYNEHNPDDEAIGRVASDDLRRRPDAVIVVGTTLKVPGIQRITREMCAMVRDRKDGMAIWISNEEPPAGPQFAECFDLIVKGPADAVAKEAALRRWDDPQTDSEVDNISDEDVLKEADAKKGSVVLPSKAKSLTALEAEPVEEGRYNNSFKPPQTEPSTPHRPRLLSQSPDYSPLTSRSSSVLPSVELSDSDSIAVASTSAQSGLLTPSKSSKSSPVGAAVPSFNDRFKPGQKVEKASSKAKKAAAAPKRKQPNVKYIKVAKPQPKTTGKPKASKPQPQKPRNTQAITSAFSVSKSGVTAAKGAKKLSGLPTRIPSKLSEVSNTSETLLPLSPSDPRKYCLPSQKHADDVELSSPEKRRKRMSVDAMLN
nr:hypothetical protein B0A51_01043 [Rachicladosporium sp. CCFEE 5018]